jgi:tetratricopeptide (TPR) repeat protein
MNGDFMYFQMLIDRFVCDDFPSEFLDNYSTFAKSKDVFIEACKEEYKNETRTLAKITEFEHNYTPEQALSWYTRNSFIYNLLNRALRTNDTRLILVFCFLIIDLYKQLVEKSGTAITEENVRSWSPVYYVYRGQLMSKHELDNLRQSLGSIISVKSFLSTSLDRQIALFFLGQTEDVNQSSLIPVLIEIELGNYGMNSTEKPFANITDQSSFDVEKEVLFMAGSYFRVNEVHRDEKNIWRVRFTTLGPFENPLQSRWGELYRHMRTNFIPPILLPPHTGSILFQSSYFNEAETYYKRLIQHINQLNYVPEETEDEEEYELPSSTGNESRGILGFLKDLVANKDDRKYFEDSKTENISVCYYALGRITNEKGLYDQSIGYYEMVLNRTQSSLLTHERPGNSSTHILRALCYSGLGAAYELNGNSKHAFESYTEALQMFEQAHDGFIDKMPGGSGLTHAQKAHCLIGLGNLRLIKQDYEQAETYYREALSLFDKYLPVGHPDQSLSRQKIANIIQIYRCKPSIALEDYEDCLQNYLRALPSDHVDIARVYTDMARAYEQLPNELKKSLEYAEKAMHIFEKHLPEEHVDNVTIRRIIKQIQRKLHLET